MAKIKMDVIEKIASISDEDEGYRKELNLVSWNGREPKYDLRKWAPNGLPLKGIAMTEDEVKELQRVLNEMFAE